MSYFNIERGCWRFTLVVSVLLALLGGWLSISGVSGKYTEALRIIENTPSRHWVKDPVKERQGVYTKYAEECAKIMQTPPSSGKGRDLSPCILADGDVEVLDPVPVYVPCCTLADGRDVLYGILIPFLIPWVIFFPIRWIARGFQR